MYLTDLPKQKEEVLIKKAVKGNLEAFNQLVLLYQNMAYNYAYALLGNAVSAEDNTQESFLKAYQKIGGFRGGSFRAWLLKIVTNTSYDFLRRSKRHSIQPLFAEDDYGEEIESTTWLVDPSNSVEETVEQNEETQRLYQLLDELPEIYRSVLTLVDLNELDYSEVTEILNVPLGTVKSRLSRARLLLRAKLQGESKYFPDFSQTMSVLPS